MKELPPAEYLRERLDYDPETGVLTWKRRAGDDWHTRKWNTRYAGKVAGQKRDSGYIAISIDDIPVFAHRVIWKMVTGEDPPDEIDHKDGLSNAWSNLRLADRSGNTQNCRAHFNNASGFKGVSKVVTKQGWQRWIAQIQAGRQRHHLGTFDTPEAAAEAYRQAAERLHGEFAKAYCRGWGIDGGFGRCVPS